MKVTAIPAFEDNYLWLIEDETETWIVDPGDGQAVQKVLNEKSRCLDGILITHHHHDHVGGLELLIQKAQKQLPVFGPTLFKHPLVNHPVSEGDKIQVCGMDIVVMDVPGHTRNHVAYYREPKDRPPILFCGDTLFAGGCGRIFDGTAQDLYWSLQRFKSLPPETIFYCAHEYTEDNLRYAKAADPFNDDLDDRITEIKKLRTQALATVPSTIEEELKTNCFLRTSEPSVVKFVRSNGAENATTEEEVFVALRDIKTNFKT